MEITADLQKRYSDAGRRVDRHLAEGDLVAAARLTHDLKGISWALGATALFEASRMLDDELRTGAPAQGTVSRFQTALDAVLKALKSCLAESQRLQCRPMEIGPGAGARNSNPEGHARRNDRVVEDFPVSSNG